MSEEKVKKPFYKKWWFWAIIVVLIFGPIISSLDDEEQAEEETTEKVEDDTETSNNNENQEEQDSSLDKKIDLENEFLFSDFTIYMDEAHIYEENGEILMELSFDWLNNSFGDDTKFMSAASIDVYQNNELLEETTNAYADTKSDVHFPNAVGGKWGIDLTYKLTDEDSEVRIVFVPLNETDDSEELIIEIK